MSGPREKVEEALRWWEERVPAAPQTMTATLLLRDRLMCLLGEHASPLRTPRGGAVLNYLRCSLCGEQMPTTFFCGPCDKRFATPEEVEAHRQSGECLVR
jgi:hypothetical protein